MIFTNPDLENILIEYEGMKSAKIRDLLQISIDIKELESFLFKNQFPQKKVLLADQVILQWDGKTMMCIDLKDRSTKPLIDCDPKVILSSKKGLKELLSAYFEETP